MMSEPAAPAGIIEGRGSTATYFLGERMLPFTISWNMTGQPAASCKEQCARRHPGVVVTR